MRRHLVVAFIALSGVSGTAALAQTINYPNFSNVSGLQLNGDAFQNGNQLTLTQATVGQSGSAFSTNTILLTPTASFSTFFSFDIQNRGGLGNGADGLTFTVQTQANNVGGGGGGLGYAGINNSVAVEFDTFDNGEPGGSNHVGIDVNGDVNSIVSTGLLTPDFDNAAFWYAWVDYDGTTQDLSVRWSQVNSRPTASMLDAINLDLPTILGSTNVFVGFTAGTGSGWGEHNIDSWSFVNQFQQNGAPPPTSSAPEPASLALMLTGLAGLGFVRRRRRR